MAPSEVHQITEAPSPNQNDRPQGVKPSLVVIHGTAGQDQGDLDWLRKRSSGVSYHYLVLRDGSIHKLVDPSRRAWHAGKSRWRDVGNVNDFSIGIGLSNDGRGEQYTTAQYRSAGWLCAIFRREFGITADKVVGHYHVSGAHLRVRDDPKSDPWDWFEWGRLYAFADTYYGQMMIGAKQAA